MFLPHVKIKLMIEAYRKYFGDKNFVLTCVFSFLFLTFAFVVNYFASAYATLSASGSVTDLVLSNTRVWDVDLIFIYGAIFVTFFVIVLCLSQPSRLPFVMKSWALFIIIRCVFVVLTHISPFPTHAIINSTFFQRSIFDGIFTGNDLFFSGHTGAPFLMALIFWNNRALRAIFLGASVLFGIVVLLGHLHYSIDVLSAFFITYAIFDICKYLFKRDYNLFIEQESPSTF